LRFAKLSANGMGCSTSVQNFIPDLSISLIAVFEICEPENRGGTAYAAWEV
jgi:hypothetical protein